MTTIYVGIDFNLTSYVNCLFFFSLHVIYNDVVIVFPRADSHTYSLPINEISIKFDVKTNYLFPPLSVSRRFRSGGSTVKRYDNNQSTHCFIFLL